MLDTLRDFAVKEGVDRCIDFGTEVVTVRELPSGRCSRWHLLGPCFSREVRAS